MSATEKCPGAGYRRSFSVGDTYGEGTDSPTGLPKRAMTHCPRCEWRGKGRIVRSDSGIKLSTPLVITPVHKPK